MTEFYCDILQNKRKTMSLTVTFVTLVQATMCVIANYRLIKSL